MKKRQKTKLLISDVFILVLIVLVGIMLIVVFLCMRLSNVQWGCKYTVNTNNKTYYTDAVIYYDGGIKFVDLKTNETINVSHSQYEIHKYPFDETEMKVLT